MLMSEKKMEICKDEKLWKADLLAFQRRNWKHEIRVARHNKAFVELSVTTNGNQWGTISILRDKLPKLIRGLKRYAINPQPLKENTR